MLYLIHKGNHAELSYTGGQEPIVHLEADMRQTVAWAETESQRWAFTLSNAGSYFFEDRADLSQLDEVDWGAIEAANWQGCKDGKQAEFLVEHCFPWHLVERIGVLTSGSYGRAVAALPKIGHRPRVERIGGWYY